MSTVLIIVFDCYTCTAATGEKRRLQHDDTVQGNGKNQICCVFACINYWLIFHTGHVKKRRSDNGEQESMAQLEVN